MKCSRKYSRAHKMLEILFKKCSKCKEPKKADQFHRYKTGLQAYCKKCVNAKNYFDATPERDKRRPYDEYRQYPNEAWEKACNGKQRVKRN